MKWKLLGHCGVDAGMLMVGDPCYFIGKDKDSAQRYKDWGTFLGEQDYGRINQMAYAKGHSGLGVVASTSYGDGVYPVYGLFNSEDSDSDFSS